MTRDIPNQHDAKPAGTTAVPAENARAGSISGRVIIVLAVSLVLAIAVMIWVLVSFYMPLTTT